MKKMKKGPGAPMAASPASTTMPYMAPRQALVQGAPLRSGKTSRTTEQKMGTGSSRKRGG
jgi:hypothetical protein